MRVVAEEPWDWLLFEEDGHLWLDVLVEHGAVSFTVTAELDPAQAATFEHDGPMALMPQAASMRDRALRREWRIPPLPASWSENALVAIRAWRQDHPV